MRLKRSPKHPIVIGIALLLLVSLCCGAETERVRWYRSLKDASAAAQKTNQPMMIEFWADWCEPCKVMEKEVYMKPEVAAAITKKMVPLRLNFDTQKDLVRRFNVEAIPYLVFTSSYGTELVHQRGLMGAETMMAVLDALPSNVSVFNQFDRILQKDDGNVEALTNMASQLRAAGLYQSSNAFYERALKTDGAKNNLEVKERLFLETGMNFLDLKDGRQALGIFERCLKDFSGSRNVPTFHLGMGRSYLLLGRKDEARRSLNLVITGFPQSMEATEARSLLVGL